MSEPPKSAKDIFLAALDTEPTRAGRVSRRRVCRGRCSSPSGRGPASSPRRAGQLPGQPAYPPGAVWRWWYSQPRSPPSTSPSPRSPARSHRPLQAAAADRRRGHGRRLHGRADRAGQAAGGAEDHQAGHGHPAGDRPLRGRAAGPGDDGPPEHRQGARRRDDRIGPALLRDGTGQGRPDHAVTATSSTSRPGSGWSCSCRSARPSSTPIRRESSTATSSRRTSWWPSTTTGRCPR